jgi:hypothetical protein
MSMRICPLALAERVPTVWTDDPNVIVPFVPRFLRGQTIAAVPNARFVDVSSDNYAYWRLLRSLWSLEETFVIVEHDMVPSEEMIPGMWSCPEVWCAHAYRMDSIVETALGLVKFGSALLRSTSSLLDGIMEQHRVWSGLDSIVIAELHRRGYKEHVHQPPVRHLHEPAPPPEPRRLILTKLHFIGDGTRYLLGIPAADFETFDPQTVAVCLESGLYVETPQARRVRKWDRTDTLAYVHKDELIVPTEAVESVLSQTTLTEKE